MEKRGWQAGFGPVWGPDSRALILGSYPSPKSFAYGFYYGHPQNRFWPLLGTLCNSPVPDTIEGKRALLLQHGLALWDTLERCEITGASDTSIKNPVPNDIAALLAKCPIQAVFCNGAASFKIYTRYCLPHTGLNAIKLPSTSPANAACTWAKLLEAWQPLAAYIR